MILLILVLELLAHGPSENGASDPHRRRCRTPPEQNKGDDGDEFFHEWMGVGVTKNHECSTPRTESPEKAPPSKFS